MPQCEGLYSGVFDLCYFGYFYKPNLWFACGSPFTKTTEITKTTKKDEGSSESYKQGVERWIRGNHGNHGNDENDRNPGCKPRVPQTTGLEIPVYFDLLNQMGLCKFGLAGSCGGFSSSLCCFSYAGTGCTRPLSP